MSPLCDECGEVDVDEAGDVCIECTDDYRDAEADFAFGVGEQGLTPGER